MEQEDLERAERIAKELTKSRTDPNEVAKAFTYLRTHPDGRRFFAFLGTLVTEGGYLVRSGRTLDYYREIRRVCEKYLKPYQDKPDEMAQILGWAVRLMRYYAIEPTLAPPRPKSRPNLPSHPKWSSPIPNASRTCRSECSSKAGWCASNPTVLSWTSAWGGMGWCTYRSWRTGGWGAWKRWSVWARR